MAGFQEMDVFMGPLGEYCERQGIPLPTKSNFDKDVANRAPSRLKGETSTPYYIKEDEHQLQNSASAMKPAPYYIKDDEPKLQEDDNETVRNKENTVMTMASDAEYDNTRLGCAPYGVLQNKLSLVPCPYYIKDDSVEQRESHGWSDTVITSQDADKKAGADGYNDIVNTTYQPILPIKTESELASPGQISVFSKLTEQTACTMSARPEATLSAIDGVIQQAQAQEPGTKKSYNALTETAQTVAPQQTSSASSVTKPVPGFDTLEDYVFYAGNGLFYGKTGEKIGNFTVAFTAQIYRVAEDGSAVIFYEVQADNGLNQRASLLVTAQELEKLADKVRGKNGVLHLAYDNRHADMRFKTFISLLFERVANRLPARYEYDFVGWGVDPFGRPFYCSHSMTECVFQKNHRYVPRVPGAERTRVLDAWIDFLAVGKNIAVILPLWLYYSFYGFSLRLLREAGFHGHLILMVRGKSGSLKSAVTETMAMSDARGGMNFESTLPSMEEWLFELRDNVVNLDDLNDPHNKEKTRKLEHLLRCLADDIPKYKFDVTVRKPRALRFRVGCLITAEQPILQNTSSRLRYVVIDVDRVSFNGVALKPYQDDMARAKATGGYTQIEGAYSIIIAWLEENYYSLIEELKHLIIEVDPRIREPRYISNYRDFMALVYLAERFLQECVNRGYLPAEVLNRFRCIDAAAIFTEILLANQAEALQTESWKQALSEIMLAMTDGSMPIAENAANFAQGNGRFFGFYSPKGQLVLMADKVLSFAIERVRIRSNGNRHLTAKEIEDGLDKAKIIGRDEPEGKKLRHRRRQRITVNKEAKRLWWTWNAAEAEAVWEDMDQENGGFIS